MQLCLAHMDITLGDSFREIRMFQKYICSIRIDEHLPLILVGNKCDLYDEREVSSTEGHELAKEIGCPFFEASAEERVNVDEIFNEAVRKTRSYSHWNKLLWFARDVSHEMSLGFGKLFWR